MDRRCRKLCRLIGIGGMTDNHGARRQAEFFGPGAAHKHHRRRTVRDRTGIGRGYGASRTKRRLQGRYLVEPGLAGLFIDRDAALASTSCENHRCDFAAKRTVGDGVLRAGQGGYGESVLLLAGEAIFGSAVLGECSH